MVVSKMWQDLSGNGTIQKLAGMMDTEMDEHLGYGRYEHSDEPNYHNGTKQRRPLSAIYPVMFIDAVHLSSVLTD